MDIYIFYQGVPIENFTNVPGPVSQLSAESYYNLECTAGMSLAHFRMINNELLNKDTDSVPEQATIIILDSKSAACVENYGKDTKHTRHIDRRMHFLMNGEEYNL